MGAKVIHINFNGYDHLSTNTIKHCTGDWIFSLDSDERWTVAVKNEILSIIENSNFDIYKVPRRNFFMGKWIKYSGWYPNFRQPQLFRNGSMKYDNKPVHEGFINLSKNRIGVLQNSI